jgi:hypothetical protein
MRRLEYVLGSLLAFALVAFAADASAQSVNRATGVTVSVQRPTGVSISVQRPTGVTVSVQRPTGVSITVTRPSGVTVSVQRPAGVNVPSRFSGRSLSNPFVAQGTITGGSTERLTQPVKEITVAPVQATQLPVYPRTKTIELWTTPAVKPEQDVVPPGVFDEDISEDISEDFAGD